VIDFIRFIGFLDLKTAQNQSKFIKKLLKNPLKIELKIG